MPADDLLMSFYGDDFTGSTDALEALSRHGVRTVLFTEPPTKEQLSQCPGLRAFGIAGMTRSLDPAAMEQTLRPIFQSLKTSGSPIVHYKVCSTFDSSPTVGSIGQVIDLGLEIFAPRIVPVLSAAPALGRYCVFGNLFARSGGESEPYRLDRHPSMSRHPITPMDEADLRRHLGRQTQREIGLLDVLTLELPVAQVAKQLSRLIEIGATVALIDGLYDHHLKTIGAVLAGYADSDHPAFIVGSSGVEAALCAHWNLPPIQFAPVHYAGPILAVCGSCSPVTAAQIRWAIAHGFKEVALDVQRLTDDALTDAVNRAAMVINEGNSVVIHTSGDQREGSHAQTNIGPALAAIVRRLLARSPVRRMLVAGGDTSSQLARALEIQSVEMIAELTRGSPLCKARAPGSPADGMEITFKGGQIGNQDFFGLVERGPQA